MGHFIFVLGTCILYLSIPATIDAAPGFGGAVISFSSYQFPVGADLYDAHRGGDREAVSGKIETRTRDKVFFNIKKTRMGLTGEWFQKMTGTDEIWEFRTLYNRQYIRLFAFWDKRDKRQILIICTHGLMKTTAKTPKGEIVYAEQVKARYFNK